MTKRLEEFDIRFEVANAAKVPFPEFDLPLVHTLTPMGFDDGKGGLFMPTVWEMQGKYVCGYQTSENQCVAFTDWPVSDFKTAKDFAHRVSGLASELARGLR